jgi:hypothetical protein
VAAGDGATARARGAAFHAIEEIQPSRHRMALALPADGDPAAVLEAWPRPPGSGSGVRNATA